MLIEMELLIITILSVTIGSILCEQNYVVDNESFEAIEGDEETLIDLSDIKCVRREHALNGSIVILEDLDDEAFTVTIEVYTSSSGNNDFRKFGVDVPKTGSCEAFKKFYTQFVQPAMRLDENTDLPLVPEDGLCPFPKDTYYMHDIILDTEKWPNHVPRGRLKAVVKFYKTDAVIGGFVLIINVQDR